MLVALAQATTCLLDQVSVHMLERRGGKCFAWDDGRAMLCVAVKRRVQLLHYDGSDFIELKEVALPHSPLHMMWLGNNVCFAFKTGCDPARPKTH